MNLILISFTMLLFMGSACSQQTAEDWNNKSIALYEQGRYDEAIRAYDEAIRLDPQYAEAWYNKGAALEALGRGTESHNCFRQSQRAGI